MLHTQVWNLGKWTLAATLVLRSGRAVSCHPEVTGDTVYSMAWGQLRREPEAGKKLFA